VHVSAGQDKVAGDDDSAAAKHFRESERNQAELLANASGRAPIGLSMGNQPEGSVY